MSDTNLLIRKRKRVREGLIELAIRLSSLIAIISLLLIFIFIGKEAIPILTSGEIQEEVSIKSLFFPLSGGSSPFVWQPISKVPKYSILPLFIGTLKVTVVSLLIAIPIALGAALFTAEFAPVWLREILKPVVELLAGIPSVVVGFFALMVLATWFQNIFGFTFRLNAITAGMGLALAVIPIIYTVAEDAFLAVPESYREGSFALGATTWQTAWRVVLPAALPGAFAACVLGFGRAIGETMIVLMASGNSATLSMDPTLSFRSFSASIAAELAEVVVGSAHYHVLFFLGAFLFIMTFLTNLAGHWYVQRLQRKLSGA
jgi:phosphate transport system permease protein